MGAFQSMVFTLMKYQEELVKYQVAMAKYEAEIAKLQELGLIDSEGNPTQKYKDMVAEMKKVG